MGNFNKGKFGGGNKFGGNRGGGKNFGGKRDGARPDMHRATCSECGKGCEVPFRPSGDKPIFCSDCFEGKREGGPRDERGGRDVGNRDSRPHFENKRPHDHGGGKTGESYKKELEQINVTLNRILKALTSETHTETKEYDGTDKAADSRKKLKAAVKEVDTVELSKAVHKATGKKIVKKALAKKVATKSATKKKAVKKSPAKKKAAAKKK